MGFLDNYDVDLEEFNDAGFDVPDGLYAFEVTTSEIKEGTQKDEDAVHIVVKLSLENEDGEVYQYNWWLRVPTDPAHPSRREVIAMSDWKKWLLGAGFPAESLGEAGPEDIEGITGTVTLATGRPNKAGTAFQNPKNWTFDGAAEAAAEPAPAKAAKAAPAKPAKAAPAPAAKAKGNPFAKKA